MFYAATDDHELLLEFIKFSPVLNWSYDVANQSTIM